MLNVLSAGSKSNVVIARLDRAIQYARYFGVTKA
jgi:hypothetical protein